MKVFVGAGLVAASLVGAAVFGSGVASADTTDRLICTVLDEYPSPDGVLGVALGLVDNGYTPEAAGEKVATAVLGTCPEHLPAVVEFANSAGGGSGTKV